MILIQKCVVHPPNKPTANGGRMIAKITHRQHLQPHSILINLICLLKTSLLTEVVLSVIFIFSILSNNHLFKMNFIDEQTLLNPETLQQTSEFASEKPCICFHLSLRARVFGFLCTFTFGGVFLILCIPLLGTLLVAPSVFGIFYSMGLILLFSSMLFLYGPKQQLLKLFSSPLRCISFFVCVIATIFTFFCVFKFRYILFILLSIILQLGASMCYGFSLLPFSQSLTELCFKKQSTN
ncbi:Got1/Sft2-like family, putative [Entamoeba histolytica]